MTSQELPRNPVADQRSESYSDSGSSPPAASQATRQQQRPPQKRRINVKEYLLNQMSKRTSLQQPGQLPQPRVGHNSKETSAYKPYKHQLPPQPEHHQDFLWSLTKMSRLTDLNHESNFKPPSSQHSDQVIQKSIQTTSVQISKDPQTPEENESDDDELKHYVIKQMGESTIIEAKFVCSYCSGEFCDKMSILEHLKMIHKIEAAKEIPSGGNVSNDSRVHMKNSIHRLSDQNSSDSNRQERVSIPPNASDSVFILTTQPDDPVGMNITLDQDKFIWDNSHVLESMLESSNMVKDLGNFLADELGWTPAKNGAKDSGNPATEKPETKTDKFQADDLNSDDQLSEEVQSSKKGSSDNMVPQTEVESSGQAEQETIAKTSFEPAKLSSEESSLNGLADLVEPLPNSLRPKEICSTPIADHALEGPHSSDEAKSAQKVTSNDESGSFQESNEPKSKKNDNGEANQNHFEPESTEGRRDEIDRLTSIKKKTKPVNPNPVMFNSNDFLSESMQKFYKFSLPENMEIKSSEVLKRAHKRRVLAKNIKFSTLLPERFRRKSVMDKCKSRDFKNKSDNVSHPKNPRSRLDKQVGRERIKGSQHRESADDLNNVAAPPPQEEERAAVTRLDGATSTAATTTIKSTVTLEATSIVMTESNGENKSYDKTGSVDDAEIQQEQETLKESPSNGNPINGLNLGNSNGHCVEIETPLKRRTISNREVNNASPKRPRFDEGSDRNDVAVGNGEDQAIAPDKDFITKMRALLARTMLTPHLRFPFRFGTSENMFIENGKIITPRLKPDGTIFYQPTIIALTRRLGSV